VARNSTERARDADRRDDRASPADLARRTSEADGEGAGPWAPETLEPTQGRDDDGPSGPPQRDLGARR
jgi:hypothetical protein